jgi:putative addiction module killer protein
MIDVLMTTTFKKWLKNLKNPIAKVKIQARIKRVEMGNFGDIKPIGYGLSELRVNEGAGYRLYMKNENNKLVILLCAGDKSTQQKDIDTAIKMAKELENLNYDN